MKLSLITATHFRATVLANRALPSVLQQTDSDFEWIVVNDGRDSQTYDLIRHLRADCSVTYLEMDHPDNGFGLCHARNLGKSVASGDILSYLDDDNAIAPTFVVETKSFFQQHPEVRCSMVQQRRRRDIIQNGESVKLGQPFISPSIDSTTQDLIQHKKLFDSNGFSHDRLDAPNWNPDYKVFADYEYFLQCLEQWGDNNFRIHPSILVEYVQSSEGVIGQSSYGEWATELHRLLDQGCWSALTEADVEASRQLIQRWQDKQRQNELIPAFTGG